MKKILTTAYCFHPVQMLRDKIEEMTGKKYYILTDISRIQRNDEILLRYGNSQPLSKGQDTSFNSPEFINYCANKLAFSHLMAENKIYSPSYHTGFPPTGLSFPIMIRENLFLSGGRGIHIVESEEEFNNVYRNGWYWTQFINLSSEYRLHVLGGKITKILKKVVGPETPNEKFPIRNYARGWKFSIRTNLEAFPKFQELINRLNEIEVFQNGGKFYGLDVGIREDTKEVFVIENNSAVGLSDPDVEMYLDYLIPELHL